MTNPKEALPFSERLQKGAAILGRLWKRGVRCEHGWNIDPLHLTEQAPYLSACGCDPETEFCRARRQWVRLARENGVAITDGEYGLAISLGRHWDATQLTITLETSDQRAVKVGPKGSMSMAHYLALLEDENSARSIFALLAAFPKARVEGILAAGVGLPVNQKGEFL